MDQAVPGTRYCLAMLFFERIDEDFVQVGSHQEEMKGTSRLCW